MRDREFCELPHRALCLSSIFGKNFLKVTVLLNKLLKSWFEEMFLGEREFFNFPHCTEYSVQCGKMKNLLSPKKYRQINYFVILCINNNVAFTKFMPKKCESKFPHCFECAVRSTQCGKTKNLVSPKKYFVKSTL